MKEIHKIAILTVTQVASTVATVVIMNVKTETNSAIFAMTVNVQSVSHTTPVKLAETLVHNPAQILPTANANQDTNGQLFTNSAVSAMKTVSPAAVLDLTTAKAVWRTRC